MKNDNDNGLAIVLLAAIALLCYLTINYQKSINQLLIQSNNPKPVQLYLPTSESTSGGNNINYERSI